MFVLPCLDYAYDALEPYIDSKTMEIHLTKHHQIYIDNLNAVLSGYENLKKLSLDELLTRQDWLPQSNAVMIANYGGGHFNHSFFWQVMKPKSSMGRGLLVTEIQKQFGTFQAFKNRFETAAKTHFGSGWAWLVLNSKGNLEVITTANQDTPLALDSIPLLCVDVWEHAYYLQYQNRRTDFIDAWWNVIHWDFVEHLYRQAIGK